MSTWRAFCETLHLVVLGLWLGTLFAVGAAAAVIFPTTKALNVRLADFPGDGADHYRIVAGRVAERVFLIGDAVMFPCALIAAATLGVLFAFHRIPVARPAAIIRSLAMGVALASFAALLLIVTPGINKGAQGHFAAAKMGDAAAAQMHRAAVDDLHPIATLLLFVEFVSIFIALVCGAWSLARPHASVPTPISTSGYEVPALARGGKRA